jgi:hypothetical protein
MIRALFVLISDEETDLTNVQTCQALLFTQLWPHSPLLYYSDALDFIMLVITKSEPSKDTNFSQSSVYLAMVEAVGHSRGPGSSKKVDIDWSRIPRSWGWVEQRHGLTQLIGTFYPTLLHVIFDVTEDFWTDFVDLWAEAATHDRLIFFLCLQIRLGNHSPVTSDNVDRIMALLAQVLHTLRRGNNSILTLSMISGFPGTLSHKVLQSIWAWHVGGKAPNGMQKALSISFNLDTASPVRDEQEWRKFDDLLRGDWEQLYKGPATLDYSKHQCRLFINYSADKLCRISVGEDGCLKREFRWIAEVFSPGDPSLTGVYDFTLEKETARFLKHYFETHIRPNPPLGYDPDGTSPSTSVTSPLAVPPVLASSSLVSQLSHVPIEVQLVDDGGRY